VASFKILILEPAIIELEEACNFYNEKSSELGFELTEEVFAIFELIKENPLLFPIKFGNIHEAVVRRFPFIIAYEVQEMDVIVIAIFHTKQNPERKTTRRP